MRSQNCDLNIIVRDRSIPEFKHPTQNDFYIEGRSGSEFEIEFANRNSFRIEVVFSVDGLSVRDGKEAGIASRGYIVEAYGRLRVPGWTLDNSNVAKFEFAGSKGGSYVEQINGNALNKGVIGAMVYREAIMQQPIQHLFNNNIGYPSVQPWYSTCVGGSAGTTSGGDAIPKSATLRSFAPTMTNAATATASMTTSSFASDTTEQTLGTGFGDSTSFQTQQVSFLRGMTLGTMALFYDDARGLKARGIEIKRENKVTPRPNPFPGTGCQPPLGWKG